MQSDSNDQPHPKRHHILNFIHSYRIHIGLLTSVLFCVGFWNNMPEFTFSIVAGKLLASLGIFILFAIIAYRVKWSAAVGFAATFTYLIVLQFQPVNNLSYTQIENEAEEVTYSDNRNK